MLWITNITMRKKAASRPFRLQTGPEYFWSQTRKARAAAWQGTPIVELWLKPLAGGSSTHTDYREAA